MRSASLSLVLIFTPLLPLCAGQPVGQVVTIAGTGESTSTGDGGSADEAGVAGPFGLVIGPDGALYVCETSGHAIRRIDLNTGIIETVAGTHEPGYSGDGGPAAKAQLNEPYEIRFDDRGNMFFVEMKNHIVRRVDAKTGIISTVAGTGELGFSGDDGPAVKAQMNRPHSIALDNAGHLYVCDIGNHRIRRVDLSSGVITTFAGTGQKKPTPDGASLGGTPLNGPRALDFDGSHSLYLALREGNAVYRIDLNTETLHHLAGTGEKGYTGDGGDAKAAKLSGPKGIALAKNGDIYLADTESHTIRFIRKKSGIIETLIGDGERGDGPDGNPLSCRLDRPHGVFVADDGVVYVGDSSNHKVRRFVPTEATSDSADSKEDLGWMRVKLDDAFRSEGVAVADVNRDGKLDVLAGDVWYEAPEWKMHEIRPPGEFVAGVGYSNSFANWAYDINGDGWDDFILVGFPGAPFHWYENPKNQPGHWKEHLIWHSACNESPDFVDLDGDQRPELLLGSQPERQMGLVTVTAPAQSKGKWEFRPISEPGDPAKNGTFKYYHGLGHGDLNGDGRLDVLIPHGWWEQPEKKIGQPWTFHSYILSPDGKGEPLKAADMHVDDLNLDGAADIIMSSAHTFGVWWFEQVPGPGELKFRYHLIDDSYSQTHAMEYVDINGDGQRDIVTGKRYFAHNGRDPGGKEPVVMYWYEIRRKKNQPPTFIPHEIVAGRGTGVGTQFLVTDMNGDSRPDIVLSNKSGVNLLMQKTPTKKTKNGNSP